jgi:RNA polymerase sigma-70 factor (ECF subfamily)
MNADPSQLGEWLAATAAGDMNAFRRLYVATSPHLYSVLLRMLKRQDWAEEALQDCYVRIWQKSETYVPDKGTPQAWLGTIARYRALDLLRVKRPEVEMPEEDETPPMFWADPTQDPLARAVEQEGVDQLQRCLGGLAPEQQRSVLLAYYDGYTHQELAEHLKAPLGTVKSWVRRGLSRLRECLEGGLGHAL